VVQIAYATRLLKGGLTLSAVVQIVRAAPSAVWMRRETVPRRGPSGATGDRCNAVYDSEPLAIIGLATVVRLHDSSQVPAGVVGGLTSG
jgi:hypothetical protein